MEFQININNVILNQLDQVESGEYNVTECSFTFSNEYEGLTKKAVFTGEDGVAYLETIVDNKCPIPNEILAINQVVQIGVYAYAVDGEELLLRYSPEPTQFYIHQGSYKEAQNSTPPTPSEIEQLQAQITQNANDIDTLEQTTSEQATDISNLQSDVNDIKEEQTEQNTKIQNNTNNITILANTKADKNEIPIKTSELINDSDFVEDANYVHTDNNFTDEKDAQITTNANNITTLQSTKADKSEIPTKTSQLTNDSGFITKNVDDLANYYKKSETYNKTEIDGKVSSVYKYKGTVATYQDLPSTDLTIGDVYNVEEDGSNYAWTGNAWDKLGGDIDLSEYYTKTQTDSLLSAKANSNDVYTKNETYNKTEVNTLLNDKVDKVQGKGLSTNDFTNEYKEQITTNQTAISNIKDGTTIDSFGDVETALNSKEDKSNKVTEITDQSTDTQYPSAKCVYDSQEEQNTEIEALQQENEELEQDVEDLRNASYKVEGTGTDITLNNTASARLLDIELKGQTSQETTLLPSEYQQVEYIESTGTEYIDTGVIPTVNTGYSVKAKLVTNDSGDKILIGSRVENERFWFDFDQTGDPQLFVGYGYYRRLQNYITDTLYDISFNLNNSRKAYVNDNEYTITSNYNDTDAVSMFIFRANYSTPFYGKFKLYKCKIYNNNILQRDFVPCYRKSDNEIGLYDLVNNEFYTNQGTGTFNKGNDITSLPTPEFEIPIKNVTGNANTKIQNKNLFNKSLFSAFTTSLQYVNVQLQPLTTYIMSTTLPSNVSNSSNLFVMNSGDTAQTGRTDVKPNTPRTVTTLSDGIVKIGYRNSNSAVDNPLSYDYQIEQGTTATDFVPHQEQNYPFTFAEDQRAMQGTTLEDDGIHQKRKQYAITGNETWELFSNRCVRVRKNDIKGLPDTTTLGDIKCNYLIANTQADVQTGVVDYGIAIRQEGTNGIVVRNKDFTTLEQYTNWFKQLYNNNAPLLIEYPLADSELESNIIPYNETQQAQYNAMKNARSYDDITYITSESDELGFNMNVGSLGNINKVINNLLNN